MHIGAFVLLVLALGIAPHITPQSLARFSVFAAVLVALVGFGLMHGSVRKAGYDADAALSGIWWAAFGTWAFLRGLAWVFGARFGGGGWD